MSRLSELTSTGQCFDSCGGSVCGDDVSARIRLNLRKSTLEQRTTVLNGQIQKFFTIRTSPTINSNSSGGMPSDKLSSCSTEQHVQVKDSSQQIVISVDSTDEINEKEKDVVKEENHNQHHSRKSATNKITTNNNKDKCSRKHISDDNKLNDVITEESLADAAKTTTKDINSMSKLLAINPATSATTKQVVIVHCCQELNPSTNKTSSVTNNCRRLKSPTSTAQLLDNNCNHLNNLNKNTEQNHSTKRIKCIKDLVYGEKNEFNTHGDNIDTKNKNNIYKTTTNSDLQQNEGGLILCKSSVNDSNSKMIVDKSDSNITLTNGSQTPSSLDLCISPSTHQSIGNKMEEQQTDKEEPEPPSPSYSPRSKSIQRHKLVSLGSERNNSRTSIFNNKHMPWFGIDIGGTLVKVVFFDPKDATSEELITLKRIRRYLKSSKPYGTTGKRDSHLEMPNCMINKRIGTLHFIRFATSRMSDFLTMAKNKRFADTIHNVCATGGGAYKFEDDIKKNLGITLHKTDELDSIIYGIHYIDKYNSDRECYFLDDPLDDNKCVKVPYDFSRPYPYLVVNIGSGVSILAVYSSTSYSRISGSSIGGGTFLGLCCLLTQCETFDEAIKLAKAGSSSKLDKLVKDIYGGDYPKFNLSGDTVASSFGHMNIAEKRKNVKREDLARGLLEMVTINIGLIARMCAEKEDIDRVVFIGNFLRVNQLSMKLLSYAVNYWSKGAMKALFLEHEGYFGAVGCFAQSTQGCYFS